MTAGAYLVVIAGLNCLIGSYVLAKCPRAAVNKSFAFLAATVAAWTVSIAIAYHTAFEVRVSTRLTFAVASLMPLALLLLILTFPNETRLRFDRASRLFAVLSPIFLLLSFTSLIVSQVTRRSSEIQITHGPAYPFYALYVSACLAWSCRVLASRYNTAFGLTKLQFRYFLLGLLLPSVGVTITNLLVPFFFDSSRLSQYGPYFALIFLALTAHALIRYRFLDIRLVIRRSITLLLGLAASILTLGILVLILIYLLGWRISMTELLFLLFCSTLLGTLLPPLHTAFSRLLDSYTFRLHSDFQATLRTATEALSRLLDLDSLASLIVQTALRFTTAEHATLYLESGGSLHPKVETHYLDPGLHTSPPVISLASPIVSVLANRAEPIVAEEVARDSTLSASRMLSDLVQFDWAVVVPIYRGRAVIGILALGPKLSKDPFYPDDLALVSTICAQATAAITNAHLYQQVVLANEYVNNIMSTMDSAIIAASQDGHITLFNTAAERLAGVPRQTLAGASLATLPSPLGDALNDTICDGQLRLQVETTLLDHDGRLTPVMFSTSALRDEHGSVRGALLVFTDLTALKHLETQKQQAERLASLGAIASGLAHEIKNPLVAIRTFAELLPERFADADFRHDFSRLVIAEIDRIDDLVAKLRGLAASAREPTAPIDILQPIEDTVGLLRGYLEQKQITVTRVFTATSRVVIGNPAQLKQLFLNILLNAMQSMTSNGQLRITIRTDEGDSPSRLFVDISDTGTGIPQELLPTLFEPFVTTNKSLGSGLGLAICRNITDVHHATIAAKNNAPLPGATVTITFPVYVHDTPVLSTPQLTALQSPQ